MSCYLLKNAVIWTEQSPTDILIENSHIAKISPNQSDNNAQVIDLCGKTIFPGFFNAHVHLYGLNGPLPDELLRRFVSGGVTTVRDMGMTFDAPYEEYQKWYEGRRDPEYPMIISAGKFICNANTYGAVHPTGATIGHIVEENPEAAREAVDKMVYSGARLIKTGNDYGMDASNPLDYLREDVFKAIIQRARELEVPSSAHITKADKFVEAAKLGLTEAAHVPNNSMTDTQVEEAASTGMAFTATMSVFDFAAVQFGENLMEDVTANVRRLYRAGMPMAVGTDFMRENPPYQTAGIPVHEFRLLAKAGLTIEEIVKAATIDSARLCGVADQTGSIEVGKLADLVAISEPLDETFHAFEAVPFVMHWGALIKNEFD